MSTCIICGSSTDGRVCNLHEEDVVFEFEGTKPKQLIANRYYRGTVDGFAEFGIFVDIGEHVTGLLHKSELDRRLDSVDLEPGDTVYVKVKNVRDNGNIDLGWSIRQDRSRFRGALVHDPEADEERLPGEADEEGEAGPIRHEVDTQSSDTDSNESVTVSETEDTAEPSEDESESEASTDTQTREPLSLTVSELEEHVGDLVRLEGELTTARQTSGPTVFDLRDETGSVECAAFEEAGVRAYPNVGEGDVVRVEGEVERRRGEIQVETAALVVLEDEQRDAVTERMEQALRTRARPDAIDVFADDPVVGELTDQVRDGATAIRRAVIEGRPIVVRHSATADGYVASAALERATLPLIRDHHQNPDAEYHYFERRPVEGQVYDMNDATRDVTAMLSARDRHDEPLPLFVFVGAGGSAESFDGFELLDVYGARRVLIDSSPAVETIESVVDVIVTPQQSQASMAQQNDQLTATVLAANVGAHVNESVRDELEHLPAVSYWRDVPDRYQELAAEAGYEHADLDVLREAIALEAHYQSYQDKRELVIDLLFTDEADVDLAEHISEQFRTRMNTAIETAESHLERRETEGGTVLVLDTDAYTHRFEFPPTDLLLDELYRRQSPDVVAIVGIDTDEAYIRAPSEVDVAAVVEVAREQATEAALDARGVRNGRVEFLAGEREQAREAVLNALDTALSGQAVLE